MALTWTYQKPKKPYSLQTYGDYLLRVDGNIVIDQGFGGIVYFTFDRNWSYRWRNGTPVSLGTALLGTAFLVRNVITTNRVINRFVGGGNGIIDESKFYDDTLDDKLGGEYQRLG